MNKFEEITGIRAEVIRTKFFHGNAHAGWSYWYDSKGGNIDLHKKMEGLSERYKKLVRANHQYANCTDKYGELLREGDIVLMPHNVSMEYFCQDISKQKSSEMNLAVRHSGGTNCVVPAVVSQYGDRISFHPLKRFLKDVSFDNNANYFYPKRYIKINFDKLNGFEKKEYLNHLKKEYNNGNSKDTIRRDFNFFNRG